MKGKGISIMLGLGDKPKRPSAPPPMGGMSGRPAAPMPNMAEEQGEGEAPPSMTCPCCGASFKLDDSAGGDMGAGAEGSSDAVAS